MEGDDLYPNSGESVDTFWRPTEPEDQTRRREVAKSKSAAAKDFIKMMIQRLEVRVQFYNTLGSIPDTAIADETQFRIHVAANKQTIANLQIEINHWKGVLKGTK